jgi:F0F1-type ATP synthase delta subunit
MKKIIVTSAVSLDDKQINTIKTHAMDILGVKNARFIFGVDNKIAGGIVIAGNGKKIDLSIAGRIEKIITKLKNE